MMSVLYAECRLCWVSLMLYVMESSAVMSLMNNHNKLESLAQASLSNICKLDYTKNNYLYSSVFLI